jgi:hypothetical protein
LSNEEKGENPGLKSLTPSVLNQANVIQLDSIKPEDYLTFTSGPRTFLRDLNFQESPMANHLKPQDIRKLMRDVRAGDDDNGHVLDTLARHLDVISSVLKSSGFDMGCRVMNDMVRYLYLNWEAQDKPMVFGEWADTLDVQMVQRILPGLQGSSILVKQALECLYCFCFLDMTEEDKNELCHGMPVQRLLDKKADESWLTRSAFRLKIMMNSLATKGFISLLS